MAATGSLDGDAIDISSVSSVILSPFADFYWRWGEGCCLGVFPMTELQQNHSTGTEAENFLTLLQGGFLKMGLLRHLSLRRRNPAPVQGDAHLRHFCRSFSVGFPFPFMG